MLDLSSIAAMRPSDVAQLIQEAVSPDSWTAKGGTGTVLELPGGIAVTQCNRVQDLVATFLVSLSAQEHFRNSAGCHAHIAKQGEHAAVAEDSVTPSPILCSASFLFRPMPWWFQRRRRLPCLRPGSSVSMRFNPWLDFHRRTSAAHPRGRSSRQPGRCLRPSRPGRSLPDRTTGSLVPTGLCGPLRRRLV